VTGFGLLGSKLEMLGSLETKLLLGLTFLAFKTKDNLTGSLGLLVKDRLCLSTETHLLGVVTSLSLSKVGCLTSLILGHLVHLVLLAVGTCAVGIAFLWDVDHFEIKVFLTVRY
jgi:hypothetical protein